jgi:hypothetical protein
MGASSNSFGGLSMRRVAGAAVFVFAWLSWGGVARAELRPATKGRSFHRAVEQRLCFAGRFRFERSVRDREVYLARCLEQVPSCEGHPNALRLEEVHLALLGNEVFTPETRRTYCLIVTAGSKRGLTVEAFGPDDAETLKEMKAVIGAPSAFQNDATWRKRRALWAKFQKDIGIDEAPLLYCEDDVLRSILYVRKGHETYPIHLYKVATGKSEPIIHAKVIRGVNRITFDKEGFQVWFNGSIELTTGAGGEE